MSVSIFEKSVLCKLYHNQVLQKQYLEEILPPLWEDPKHQLLVFIMKYLHKKRIPINLQNIMIAQKAPEVARFKRKRNTGELVQPEVKNLLYDLQVDISEDMFREAYEELHNIAFARGASELLGEASYELTYSRPHAVLARAKGVQKLFDIIYKRKFGAKGNVIQKAAAYINEREGTIRFSFSPKLSGLVGGWTRGWAGTILGRSGHTKSTIMTLDSVLKAVHNTVGDIDIILTEESEEVFYQRVFAILLKIPIQLMRNRLIKITDAHIEQVQKLLGGRLKTHRYSSFKDIIDLLFTLRSKYIFIDHINAIQYPGSGNALINMIGGIPLLIGKQIEFLRSSPDSVVINLSQVNEKELAKLRGVWKHPSYIHAYGSQVLHQHSREYLTVYYPYKDVLNNPREWTGKKELQKAKQGDVYLKVEKSSFGDLVEVKFNFKFEFGILEDTVDKVSNIELPEIDGFLQELI